MNPRPLDPADPLHAAVLAAIDGYRAERGDHGPRPGTRRGTVLGYVVADPMRMSHPGTVRKAFLDAALWALGTNVVTGSDRAPGGERILIRIPKAVA